MKNRAIKRKTETAPAQREAEAARAQRRMGLLSSALSFTLIIVTLCVLSGPARAQTGEIRFEAGAQFSLLDIEGVGGRSIEPGVGGRLGYNITEHITAEGELNFFPREGNGASNLHGGRITQGLFGVKAGRRFARFGIFGKARPGFISYGRVILNRDAREFADANFFDFRFGRLTHFALDVGGVVEFYPSRRTILRFDVGDTVVRYGRQNFTDLFGQTRTSASFTRHNLQFSAGVGFRF